MATLPDIFHLPVPRRLLHPRPTEWGGTSYCNGNPGIRHQILGVHTLKRKSSLQSDIFLRETKVGFILATTNLNLTISMIRLL